MSTTPVTSTATRSGSRVIVTRTDDVIAGAAPIVSILTDDLAILSFTPTTAIALAHMLIRSAADVIPLTIRVTNTYATLNRTFTHDIEVAAPAPADDADLDDWMLDHLFQHTGEGPAYGGYEALYEVEITSAPTGFEYLVGHMTSAQG